MTVGRLRVALSDLPDDMEVLRCDESFLTTVDEARCVQVNQDADILGFGAIVLKGGNRFFVIDPPDHSWVLE